MNRCQQSQELIDQIKAFFEAEFLRNDGCTTCSQCGRPLQFWKATFWLQGSDSEWNLRLPVCACDRGPEVNSKFLGRSAAHSD